MNTGLLKLHGFGASRWVKPYWTLRELGVPFEPVPVPIRDDALRRPEFLALNPFGKVPVLEDGDFRLFEAAAICAYLVDRFPEKDLAPRPGTRERAVVDQWCSFALTELEQPMWRITRHTFVYPKAKRSPAEIELAREDFSRVAATLAEKLTGDFVAGDRFSLADIVLTFTLRWAQAERLFGMDLTAPFPRLREYVARHTARPAFPRELYEVSP